MKIRRTVLTLLVLVLVAAACGDDDSGAPTTAAPATGGSSGDGGTGSDNTPTPSATGGFVMLGDERIDFDSARCYLEEQDTVGGGKILANGQGYGTNADGEEVLLDFTRYDEDSMFTGDDLRVTIGDPFAGDVIDWSDVQDLGTVSIEGRTLSGAGFELSYFADTGEVTAEASFELNC